MRRPAAKTDGFYSQWEAVDLCTCFMKNGVFTMAYEFDLAGRIAFVTGASGGLGAQFARTLARAGAAVV